MRLWGKREPSPTAREHNTTAKYNDLGVMTRGLNDHANDVLAKLPLNRRQLAKKIFPELTEVGDGRDQRRPMRLSQLARRTSVDLADLTAVVEPFLLANFLTSPDRNGTTDWELDISHESLIRQWETLQNWATEEAHDREDYL